jgi:pilus assembly protein FimV
MRTTPNRVAIHAKLMEIYAKRRDAKAFEVIALQAFNLTSGEGPEWAYISEMGRELDPANGLYQPGGQPPVVTPKESGHVPRDAAFNASTVPQMAQPQHEPASASVDFDLDLDFSSGDEPVVVAPAPSIQPPEPTVAFKPVPAPSFDGLDMDFGTGTVALKSPVATLSAPSASLAPTPGFDKKEADDALSASGLTFTNEPFTPARSSAIPAPAVMDHGMLEFDMGSLSLDLDGPATESPVPLVEPATAVAEGPLDTKFALAEEFRALGDMDGARALAEEVLAQAKGSLKSKAQAFINALS